MPNILARRQGGDQKIGPAWLDQGHFVFQAVELLELAEVVNDVCRFSPKLLRLLRRSAAGGPSPRGDELLLMPAVFAFCAASSSQKYCFWPLASV